MGKVLIIKGADFSQTAIGQSYNLVIEQGIISLLNNAGKGIYSTPEKETNWYKRMRTINTGLIYIKSGTQCVISGLQGDGIVSALRVDAAIYSSAENPRHDTCLHTLNGDTTNYYKFNTEGNDSYNFVAPYTGYYAFCFAGPTLNEEVSPANYNIAINMT